MMPGDCLRALHDYMASPEFLKALESDTVWESLDIDYEPPRVERVWMQTASFRVNLHVIHPCDSALHHPHPWPSAVHVVSGSYEMALCAGASFEVARMVLTSGSSYEMVDPLGWHYVKPLVSPSLSVMLTWKPFDPQRYDHTRFGKGRDLKPLPSSRTVEIREWVKAYVG